MTACLLALLFAAADLPQAEVRPQAVGTDPRSQRPWVISLEAGWNALAGVGVVVARHFDPHLTLEAGVGLSAEGPKAGARARFNLVAGEWTPFLGVGFLYAAGLNGRQTDRTFTYTVGPSPFLQVAGGLEYQSRAGLNLMFAVGYAHLLRENLTVLSGAPTSLQIGSGPVASGSIGYAF